jgi:hypothetical protein
MSTALTYFSKQKLNNNPCREGIPGFIKSSRPKSIIFIGE